MELIYLWVEDYKNIRKQGFNFSPNFECKFFPEYEKYTDKNGEEKERLKDDCELKISPKENLLKDFFGENINVTAIVGENGSGKTSILDQIMDNNSSGIIVYFHEKELKCYKCDKIKINTNLKFEKITKNYQHSHSNDDILKVDEIVDAFDMLSTRNDFCNMNKGLAKDGLSTLDISEYSKNISALIIKHLNKLDGEIFQKVLIRINSSEVENSIKKKLLKYFIEKDKENKYVNINFEDDSFCNEVIEDYKLSEYVILLNSISEVLNGDYIDFNKLNLDDNQLILLSKLVSNSFLSIGLTRDLFNFSQGERKKIIEKLILLECFNDIENRLILLDEPDNTLHPNWQKEYINLLVTLLKDKKDIHIIITSHSPFILSDLPKQNVIFLEKDEKTGNCVNATEKMKDFNTFGANIHTLLSHGFFMKDGLMGEFAKSKIDDVINYLNNKKSEIKNDKDAQNIIDIIGEPIIKRELQRMLKNKMELSNKTEIDTIKDEIKLLTERLEKLEPKDEK